MSKKIPKGASTELFINIPNRFIVFIKLLIGLIRLKISNKIKSPPMHKSLKIKYIHYMYKIYFRKYFDIVQSRGDNISYRIFWSKQPRTTRCLPIDIEFICGDLSWLSVSGIGFKIAFAFLVYGNVKQYIVGD